MQKLFIVALGVLSAMGSACASGPRAPSIHPSLRVLVYGDAGVGEESQLAVGRAMSKRHADHPFDLGLSLGDNWYNEKYTSAADELKKIFETPYAGLIASGLTLHQTLGNHDHRAGHLEHELEYAKTHPAFGLPSQDYVITRPEIKIVVTDITTQDSLVNLPPSRMKFLEKELCGASSAPWKAIAFHYHMFNTGPRGDNADLKTKLLPLLKRCPPDFVLSGHEHHAEAFEPLGPTWFLISGNGGAGGRDARTQSELKSVFFSRSNGFMELNLTETEAQVIFRDTELNVLYQNTRQLVRKR